MRKSTYIQHKLPTRINALPGLKQPTLKQKKLYQPRKKHRQQQAKKDENMRNMIINSPGKFNRRVFWIVRKLTKGSTKVEYGGILVPTTDVALAIMHIVTGIQNVPGFTFLHHSFRLNTFLLPFFFWGKTSYPELARILLSKNINHKREHHLKRKLRRQYVFQDDNCAKNHKIYIKK